MPSLSELRQWILKSDHESEWHRIPGPSFLGELSVERQVEFDEDGAPVREQWVPQFRTHEGFAVYTLEVNLAIGWMIDGEPLGRDDPLEPWARGFVDPRLVDYVVDVFWCGQLVDRVDAVLLDGALLPQPEDHYEELEPQRFQYVDSTVPDWVAAVCRLAHHLGGRPIDTYESHIRRAGIRVVGTAP